MWIPLLHVVCALNVLIQYFLVLYVKGKPLQEHPSCFGDNQILCNQESVFTLQSILHYYKTKWWLIVLLCIICFCPVSTRSFMSMTCKRWLSAILPSFSHSCTYFEIPALPFSFYVVPGYFPVPLTANCCQSDFRLAVVTFLGLEFVMLERI